MDGLLKVQIYKYGSYFSDQLQGSGVPLMMSLWCQCRRSARFHCHDSCVYHVPAAGNRYGKLRALNIYASPRDGDSNGSLQWDEEP